MKIVLSFLFALFSLFAFAAGDEQTPTSLTGGKVIISEDAKKLTETGEGVAFDTRAVLNFGKGHLPKASPISYKEKSEKKVDFVATDDQFDLSKLPADKNKKIIFYSDGPTGWKSYKAAVTAIKSGYRNVYWLREGVTGWTAKGIALEQ